MDENPLPPESPASDISQRRSRRRSPLFSLLVPLAFVFGIGVGYLLWGIDKGQATAQTQSTPQTVKRYDVPVDDDPSIGPSNAAITIIEFSDYQCPYCRQWYNEVFARLMQAYPDQIRFVYRDFPLDSLHPNAESAAEAADCAKEQGAFWEYHDLLFGAKDGLGEQAYEQYASQLGLDQAAFDECLSSGRNKKEVQADFEFAANLGVRSTPTFFINGLPLVGAQPYEIFKQVVDKELAGEIP